MIKKITILFVYLLLLACSKPINKSVEVYVDGQLIDTLSASQFSEEVDLTNTTITAIPTIEQWKLVHVRAEKGRLMQFIDWPKQYQNKQLKIYIHNNEIYAGLFGPQSKTALFTLNQVTQIAFYSKLPEIKVENKGPVLPIVSNNKTYELTSTEMNTLKRDNTGPNKKSNKMGYKIIDILKTLDITVPTKRLQLSCNAGERIMVLDIKEMNNLHIKLNQRGQWRAVLLHDTGAPGKGTQNCRNLSEIELY